MGISTRQYQDIMNEYDAVRRRNYMAEQERKERIYALIPEIRRIDEEIAHVSVAKAKEMLLKKISNADAKKSLQSTIYDLSMEKVNLLAIHDYPADYLDPIYDCPECKDTGYIGDKKCHCFQQKIREILYRQSNIEDSAGNECFSAFRTDYYSSQRSGRERLSPRENIENVLSVSRSFIECFDSRPGQNLFIYGNAGVIYLTAYQFFDQLADYTFRRGANNAQTLPAFLHCDLLIIDDLGTELNNSFINSQLFLCINERILNKKSTIISTNLSLEQINRSYTERVFSRIIQSYTLLHIYGEDIRIKKAFSSLDE